MAGSKTGTPSIIKLVRKICRIQGKLGAGNLAARTTPEFAAAVNVLVTACHAFEALDDYPAEVDHTAPLGTEDNLIP